MKESFVGFIIFSLLFWSCGGKEETVEVPDYTGPLLEADSIQILYSDSALIRVRVEAAKQFEYENGNREFPQGIYIEFFEPDGSVSSTLQADKGYYFREKDRYTGVGNVRVIGLKDDNRLFTDTLHWSQPTERVYTKAPVLITEGPDTLRGVGLEANQNFTTYTILQPVGSTLLKDKEADEEQNP